MRGGVLSDAAFDGQTDVAVDASGNIWLSGEFQGTTSGLATLTSHGGFDAFVLKLQGSGTTFTTALARGYGGVGDDAATAVAVDAEWRRLRWWNV